MSVVVDLLQLSGMVLKPGDTVLLKDGRYANQSISISCSGSAASRITVKAQNPGRIVLTGTSSIAISGSYTTVANLVFSGAKGCIDVMGNNNRLTGCDLSCSVRIHNSNNRVDHCVFRDFNGTGALVAVWREDASENYAMIDRNVFRSAAGLGSLLIGAGDQSPGSCKSVIAWNLLDNCKGEITNMSSDNIYHRNTCSSCEGALTLRQGDRCIVHRNKFLQNRRPNSGGVRVAGGSHVVSRNLFKDITLAGVSVMNAPADGCCACSVTGNTFVDCSEDFAIGVQANADCTIKPEALEVSGNVVYKTTAGEVFSSDGSVLGVTSATFSNNSFYAAKLGRPPPAASPCRLLQPSLFPGVNEAEYGVDEPIGPTWGQVEPEASELPTTVEEYYATLREEILAGTAPAAPPAYESVIGALNVIIKAPTKDTSVLTQALADLQALKGLFPKSARAIKTASDSIKSAIGKAGTASATKLLQKSVDKLASLI